MMLFFSLKIGICVYIYTTFITDRIWTNYVLLIILQFMIFFANPWAWEFDLHADRIWDVQIIYKHTKHTYSIQTCTMGDICIFVYTNDMFTRKWLLGMHIEYSTALHTHTFIHMHHCQHHFLCIVLTAMFINKANTEGRRRLATFF